MLLVPSEQLLCVCRLRASIANTVKGQGIQAMTDDSLRPHVTLAYGQRHNGVWPVDPISWTVGEIVLVESATNKALYTVHGVWTLSPFVHKDRGDHVQSIPA
jgi:RNA 2',3'-cyclic 3'-phosphodiesterase